MDRLLCSVCVDERCLKNNIYIESLYVAEDATFQELVKQQGGSLCSLHRSIFVSIPPSLSGIQKYNRQQLLGSCQIMGCKVADAKIVSKQLFQQVLDRLRTPTNSEGKDSMGQVRSVTITHALFQQCARRALSAAKYRSAEHLVNFNIACEIESRKRSVTVLLGGASGTGKSTLASLIASRLGIATVLSTDSLRHILRCVIPEESNPILFCSTYETNKHVHTPGLSVKQACLVGYQRQCDYVFEHLRSVIEDYHNRKESIVIEGVHLNVNVMKKLMKSFSSTMPFVIVIKDKNKHKERFAVRSKYMTLDPKLNKYIACFSNIRAIQKKFISKADEVLIPKIDNSNVDRSLGLIHATIVRCLRNIADGQELYDRLNKRSMMLHEVFTMVSSSTWGSKEAQEIINSKANKGELFKRFFNDPQLEPQEEPQKCASESSSDSPEVGSLQSGSVDVDLLQSQSRIDPAKLVAVDEAIISEDEQWPSNNSSAAASADSFSSEGSIHSSHLEEGVEEAAEHVVRRRDDSDIVKTDKKPGRSWSATRQLQGLRVLSRRTLREGDCSVSASSAASRDDTDVRLRTRQHTRIRSCSSEGFPFCLGNVERINMAHEVVLLCFDPDCGDNSPAVRLLAAFGRLHSPTVHVALSQSAVSIAEAAGEEACLRCVLDHAWDVQMTETAIFNERLLSNEELHSYAVTLGGTFEDVDFDRLETKDEFLDRLAQALFAPCVGATVAVVSPSVIAECLKLLNIELGEAELVYVHLKVWAETKRGTVLNSADDWAQAEELLQKPVFLSGIPLDVSVTLQPVPKQDLPPLSSRRSANAGKLEEMLEEQVKSLSAVFVGQVSEAVGKVIEEYRPLGPDPTELSMSRVTQSLSSQHDRILSDLDRLNEVLKDAGDYGERQQEVEGLTAAFSCVQREMREVENLCVQMTETLQPRVQALEALLERVETQQKELSRELEHAKVYSFTKGFPLIVKGVDRGEDGVHYASIANRKFYDVYGRIAVFQNDQMICSLDVATFSGESRMMLPDLVSGTYDLTVLHFYDTREISRRFEFTLRYGWEDCVFCQTLGNARELEQTFVALGRGGSDLFRALTGALKAEDRTRINEFVQILMDNTLHTEAELRTRLAEQNFIVRT